MAKLSGLNAGVIVKFNVFGITREFVWLAYNHYGQSEVALITKEPVMVPVGKLMARGQFTGSFQSDAAVYLAYSSYDKSAIHQYLNGEYVMGLDEAIRSSLIPVRNTLRICHPLYYSQTESQPSPTVPSSAYTTAMMTSPIFLPSAKELGCQPNVVLSHGETSTTINYDTYGTSFPSVIQNSVPSGKNWVRDMGIALAYHHSYSTGLAPYRAAAGSFPKAYYSAVSIGGNGLMDAFAGHLEGTGLSLGQIYQTNEGCPIICLDGNCEVTGSGTNWEISKPTAIKTYRKIGGVWYRTI